jgi:hypothetical protein
MSSAEADKFWGEPFEGIETEFGVKFRPYRRRMGNCGMCSGPAKYSARSRRDHCLDAGYPNIDTYEHRTTLLYLFIRSKVALPYAIWQGCFLLPQTDALVSNGFGL